MTTRLKRIAQEARVKANNWRGYPDSTKEFNLLETAACILADAKVLLNEGATETAMDYMDMVSVLLHDLRSAKHPSEPHRNEGLKEFRKFYGELDSTEK